MEFSAGALLGHASIVLTADTYTSVLPQLYHDSARVTARLVLQAARKTTRKVKGHRRNSLTWEDATSTMIVFHTKGDHLPV
ncbi:hypothetical protein ACFLIM_48720 [Nonomuraea sp. M3C6]|uniref:Uncharacterized protein n=1 Tax=Nonomuraea marmarensis TaxID=3351344 RepID=A0ABW7AYF5_9ACTN